MKRAIWVNPFGGNSTSLDVGVSPHDVDTIAISELLRRAGFEVWLHEPFVIPRKMSSWPNRVERDALKGFSADLVLLKGPSANLGTYTFGKEEGSNRRRRDFNAAVEWLDNFQGEILGTLLDPRPSFCIISPSPKKLEKSPLYRIYSKCRYLAASSSLVRESDRHRVIPCDYWKLVELPLVPELKPDPIYRSVYAGVKGQTERRLSQIRDWFRGDEGIYSIGGIGQQLPEFPSLSDGKNVPLSEVLKANGLSEFVLCSGEPSHTWLTPRAMQSLCSGTVAAIHPEFAGSPHFPDRLRELLTFGRSVDFDPSLRTREIYDLQLGFLRELRESASPIAL